MLVTNWQFVDDLLKENIDVNNVLHLLLLSTILLKKYGRLLFVGEIMSAIRVESDDLYHFLLLLKINKKNKLSDMKIIASMIKKKSEKYDKSFIIASDSQDHYTHIKSFLDKKFDHLQIEYNAVEWGEVSVSGEGRYYKRNVVKDAEKLLRL